MIEHCQASQSISSYNYIDKIRVATTLILLIHYLTNALALIGSNPNTHSPLIFVCGTPI